MGEWVFELAGVWLEGTNVCVDGVGEVMVVIAVSLEEGVAVRDDVWMESEEIELGPNLGGNSRENESRADLGGNSLCISWVVKSRGKSRRSSKVGSFNGVCRGVVWGVGLFCMGLGAWMSKVIRGMSEG